MKTWFGMTTMLLAGALVLTGCGKKEAAPAASEEATSMIEQAREATEAAASKAAESANQAVEAAKTAGIPAALLLPRRHPYARVIESLEEIVSLLK